MTTKTHPDADYIQSIALADRDYRNAMVEANAAFLLAMGRAIRKGKEKAVAGTFVDTTPPINACRIRGDVAFSTCGSPSAMCAEVGALGNGAQTLR